MALLEVSNLGIAFGGLQAVAQFDLTIETGHLYGLIGPNGAGKSTTIRILMGMIHKTRGSAKILGKDILKDKEFITDKELENLHYEEVQDLYVKHNSIESDIELE